jgi:small conductance mechanosensitive channel
MAQESTVDTEALTDLSQKAEEIVGQVSQYGDLIIGSFFVIMGGIIAIYLIHKIAAKFLFPHFRKGRLIKVTGVTVYALILVATALMVLNSVGVDVTEIAHIALVTIFIVAVLFFFLLPFLPKLPFQIGHLVEVRGELGTVTSISLFFTTLQKFDGTLVFIPNTSIISMTIKNYSHVSSRRIELNLSVQNDIDLERTKEVLVRLMSEDERVLDEPPGPAVFVMKANADFVDLLAVCWVKNEDWFSTQCDLWERIVNTSDEKIHLAKPFLEY